MCTEKQKHPIELPDIQDGWSKQPQVQQQGQAAHPAPGKTAPNPITTQPSIPSLCRKHPHRRGQRTGLCTGTQLPPPQQLFYSLHPLPSTHFPPLNTQQLCKQDNSSSQHWPPTYLPLGHGSSLMTLPDPASSSRRERAVAGCKPPHRVPSSPSSRMSRLWLQPLQPPQPALMPLPSSNIHGATGAGGRTVPFPACSTGGSRERNS